MFVCFCFKNGIIITLRQYSVKNCWEKQQKLANLRQKRYFKNELKRSKLSDHVSDDVMSLFWSWKKFSGRTYFPANFVCRVMKGWLFKALGPVSRLFRLCSLPPLSLNAGRKLVIFKCPTHLKPQICYLFLTRYWNLVTTTKKSDSAMITWLMTSSP